MLLKHNSNDQFKNSKSQYRLMKSIGHENSAMVEWRRSPQTFVEQLGTIEAMGNILRSPIKLTE